MPDVEKKTGDFHLRLEVKPDVSEDEQRYAWMRLLGKMAHLLASISEDGRAYDLRAHLEAWKDADHGMKRRQVDFVLVLLDALQAEVGEYAKRLPMYVPDDTRAIRLGEGYGEATGWVFEQDYWGWKRVE